MYGSAHHRDEEQAQPTAPRRYNQHEHLLWRPCLIGIRLDGFPVRTTASLCERRLPCANDGFPAKSVLMEWQRVKRLFAFMHLYVFAEIPHPSRRGCRLASFSAAMAAYIRVLVPPLLMGERSVTRLAARRRPLSRQAQRWRGWRQCSCADAACAAAAPAPARPPAACPPPEGSAPG